MTNEIHSWFNDQIKNSSTKQKNTLEAFKETLDFNRTRIQKKDGSEQILFIPNKKNNILGSSLIIFLNNDGSFRRGIRIKLKSELSSGNFELTEKDLLNVLTYQDPVLTGKYIFSDINDRFLYQLTFSKNKEKSIGYLKKEAKDFKSDAGTRASGCTDWYIVTTITYSNGTTSSSEEYIGTTCDDGCMPNSDLESVCEGDGGCDTPPPPNPPEPVSKPVNWTVATGGGNPAVWRVYSDEALHGMKDQTVPGGGYFTSITHQNSSVINYAGNEPNQPFSTWHEESVVQQLHGNAAASSYVKGKQTFFDGDVNIISGTKVWLFANEF